MPVKYTDLLIDKTHSDGCLNDEMFVSEYSYWIFFCYGLFLGFCGINFYYVKYIKTFVFELILCFIGIFFAFFTFSIIPIVLFLFLNYIISVISVFFIYEDGYGRRLKF